MRSFDGGVELTSQILSKDEQLDIEEDQLDMGISLVQLSGVLQGAVTKPYPSVGDSLRSSLSLTQTVYFRFKYAIHIFSNSYHSKIHCNSQMLCLMMCQSYQNQDYSLWEQSTTFVLILSTAIVVAKKLLASPPTKRNDNEPQRRIDSQLVKYLQLARIRVDFYLSFVSDENILSSGRLTVWLN